MVSSGRMFRQRAAAVAAALCVAALALGSPEGSYAQSPSKDHRAQKKVPPKGPVQPLRKGPLAVGPNRIVSPHRPALGPRALPQGARVAPNINPAAKEPARFGANQPGIRALGNQPGTRTLGTQPRG